MNIVKSFGISMNSRTKFSDCLKKICSRLRRPRLSASILTADTRLKLIILEVLLGQGKVIDALGISKTLLDCDTISARKYLEAAKKTKDPLAFYAIYVYFQQRNIRLRGNPEFPKNEQCFEFDEYFNNLFGKNSIT